MRRARAAVGDDVELTGLPDGAVRGGVAVDAPTLCPMDWVTLSSAPDLCSCRNSRGPSATASRPSFLPIDANVAIRTGYRGCESTLTHG